MILSCNVFSVFTCVRLFLKTESEFATFFLAISNITWASTTAVPLYTLIYISTELNNLNQMFYKYVGKKLLTCEDEIAFERVIFVRSNITLNYFD